MSDGRRYKVLHAIGRGGFGTVYRAELESQGGFFKPVALKVLNPGSDQIEEIAQRFRDEARVLGLVSHRSIVRVDGLVTLNGRWTVVMEFVDGAPLNVLARQVGVSPGPGLEIVAQVAGALNAAYHASGPDGEPLRLLHRDIKPSNIMLTSAGDVKVLDFGIARAEFAGREAHTRALAFGSVQYMAPERHDLIDTHAGDIYALGMVLFELLMGERFGRTSASPKRHFELAGQRLQLVREKLGPDGAEVARLLGAMVAYEPEDRPTAREVERTCQQLARRLGDAFLSDWAAEKVPPVAGRQKRLEGDEFSGLTLVEGRMDLTDSQATDRPPVAFPELELPQLPPTDDDTRARMAGSAPVVPRPQSTTDSRARARTPEVVHSAETRPNLAEPGPPPAAPAPEAGHEGPTAMRQAVLGLVLGVLVLVLVFTVASTLGLGAWFAFSDDGATSAPRSRPLPSREDAVSALATPAEPEGPADALVVPASIASAPVVAPAPKAPALGAEAVGPERPASAPPPVALATLTVKVAEGEARVEVDGVEVGRTPLTWRGPVGAHEVRVFNRDAGFEDQRRVALENGGSTVTFGPVLSPTTARIRLVGDAPTVTLSGQGQPVTLVEGRAVEVPAGGWQVTAHFADGDVVGIPVMIKAGRPAVLECAAAFATCSLE